jgi:hypothetical protein
VELRSWGFSIVVLAIFLLWNVWQSFITKELVVALIDDLNAVKDQLVKAKLEIVEKLSVLEAALVSSVAESAEVVAAVGALRDAAQALDDVVPDSPAPVVVPVEETVTEEAPVVEVVEEAPVVEVAEETPAE